MISQITPNPRRERVRDLLRRLISEGAAHFFADACELTDRRPPLRTTTHLVGHLIREVESALRQVLRSMPAVKQRLEANPARGNQRHPVEVAAILGALNLDKNDTALLWNSFVGDGGWHEMAHRENLRWPRQLDATFTSRFDDFVDVLGVVLDAAEANYTEVTTALDAIRRKAKPDSTAEVDALVTHLAPGVTALAHVFETLPPGWLVPLRERGVFADPPDVQHHEGGSYSFAAWPQASYLARISADVPRDVADTIEAVPVNDNELIHLAFLRAACSMPPAEAARVAIHEARWLGTHDWSVGLPEAIQNLALHLLEGNEIDPATALLRSALSLLVVDANTPNARRRARMEDWDYETTARRALNPFLVKAPANAKALLFELLDLDSEVHFSRSTIDDTRQNSGEPLDVLLSALRDLLESECVSESALRATVLDLEARGHVIYERLALHLIRKHGALAPDLVVERVTDAVRLQRFETFHELAAMIADRFPDLPSALQGRVVEALRNATSEDAAKRLLGPDASTSDVAKHARYARRRWFAVLGQARPTAVEAEYRALCVGIGEPKHPTFLSWVGQARSGPTPPLKTAELTGLSNDDLLSYLRDWAPSSSDPFEPSRRGLMRELKAAAAADPVRFSQLARELRGLHSLYVAGVLWGLQEAFQTRLESEETSTAAYDAASILDLAEWATSQLSSDAGDDDDAQDWTWTRRTAVDTVLNTALLHPEARQRAATILQRLAEDEDPTSDRIAASSSDDATLSVNCVRGRAVIALIELAAEEPTVRNDTLDVAAARANQRTEPSSAVRSVLAQRFTAICALDEAKAKEVATLLFRSGADDDAAMWSIFLEWNEPSRQVFNLIRDAYNVAVQRVAATPEKSAVALAEHLARFAVWEVIPPADWNLRHPLKSTCSVHRMPNVFRKKGCSRTISSNASINGRIHSSRMVGSHS